MTNSRTIWFLIAFLIIGFITAVFLSQGTDSPSVSISIDDDDIGGVVTGPLGPEAGVWVIAETDDLATKYRKIVVTDDLGQFVLPDLPEASYQVWVRGYGLIDSTAITAAPGELLNLVAVDAPNPRAAAEIYPANYWYSLVEVPAASSFPGTGESGNGISPTMRTQTDWIYQMKATCNLCHQIGTKATREIPASLGTFETSHDAWVRRVQSGQNGANMVRSMAAFGTQGYAMFADWTDRISAGEVPPEPPRPEGLERNLVLTLWEWGEETAFIHDEITTDKRDPTVNANGLFFGTDFHNDALVILNPQTNTASQVTVSVREPFEPSDNGLLTYNNFAASPYWGTEQLWSNLSHPHNPMMDQDGRVWMTAAVHSGSTTEIQEYCKEGSDHPSASLYPLGGPTFMNAQVYDPSTGEFEFIDTCFGTHHLQFSEDEDNTLYFSTGGELIGWLNTRVFNETKDAGLAQGWCALIVDHNGDGVIGEYTEPDEALNAELDWRINPGSYGLAVNPVDNSIWFAAPGIGTSRPAEDGIPGRILRLELGDNPPLSCRTEVYEPPFGESSFNFNAYTPRGIDVDRNGIVWTALAGSGHLASFDRSKCEVLNGPEATGQHCQEGWTLHQTPGPGFKGAPENTSADFQYYNWVDQFDTLGLGENIPIANGSGSDSLLAFLPDTEEWVKLRVPYPLGFYSRGMDGRIDDPDAGWKGRGVYADYGQNAVWHAEGGKGTQSSMVKFQMRPDPLAR
ncbi:MAG: carboxypeptidase regulatory-like domain-containing protein [Gammaproteobacteria bacterium]|jgi:hypothetical protein|nr:carboxypeptidase regulatory-like domain-containing protein [Gammaproteobacteria bacterium]